MVWFVVGTLRELALSIRDLRSALAKRGRLDITSAPWVVLRGVESRWEDDPLFRNMRNVVAFHVDRDLTEKGLEALTKQERVELVQGDGRPQRHTFLKLGLEALFMGSDMDIAALERLMSHVGDDQGVGGAIEEAFILALRAVGVPILEKE